MADTQPIAFGSYQASSMRLGGANPYPQGSISAAIVELGNSVVSSITSMGTDTKYVELILNNRGPNTGGAGNGLTLVGGLAGYRINFPGTVDAGTAGVQGTLGMISGVSWNSGSPVVFSNGLMFFDNANGVTFGGSVSGQSMTITGSVVGGGYALQAGTQNASSGTVRFENSNGVTFGMSGNSRVTASVAGVSAVSAGTNVISNGTAVFSNSNGVSFGVSGSTVTAQLVPARYWDVNTPITSMAFRPLSFGSVTLQRVQIPRMSATRMELAAELRQVGNDAITLALGAGLYGISGSTITLLSTASVGLNLTRVSLSTSNPLIIENQTGYRWRSIPLGTWSITPGEYMLALAYNYTNSGGFAISFDPWGNVVSQAIYAPGDTTVNYSAYFANGILGSTLADVTAFPSSLQLSQINQTVAEAQNSPYLRLVGTGG